jgi:hypothetical protein
VYNFCWPSPAQSFSGPSPAGLMTTFYCLRFETHPAWRARSQRLYPPGTGWPSYTSRHWIPFWLPPTTRRATVEVFDPASTRALNFVPHITLQHGPTENTVSNSSFIVRGLLGFPRDHYSASPLARWLLPSNLATAVVSFVSRSLPSNVSIRHNI